MSAESRRLQAIDDERNAARREAIETKEQCDNIRTHIDTLMEPEWLERIGATSERELHIRVMRILCDYNDLRTELVLLKNKQDTEGHGLIVSPTKFKLPKHRFISDEIIGSHRCKACYGPKANGNHLED